MEIAEICKNHRKFIKLQKHVKITDNLLIVENLQKSAIFPKLQKSYKNHQNLSNFRKSAKITEICQNCRKSAKITEIFQNKENLENYRNELK